MSISRPLKNEFFKYRKRKTLPLDGSINGAPYNTFRRSRKYISGDIARPCVSAGSFLYNSFTARDYRPWINSPAVRGTEYHLDDDMFDDFSSSNERILRPFPDLGPREHFTTRQERKSLNEFFLKVMEEQYKPFVEGEEVRTPAEIWMDLFSHEPLTLEPDGLQANPLDPTLGNESSDAAESDEEAKLDHYPTLPELAEAFLHLQKVFPDDHQDMINLRGAMREILGFEELWPELDEHAAGDEEQELTPPLSNDDNITGKAKQIFDQQMQLIGRNFNGTDIPSARISTDDLQEESRDWADDGFAQISDFPDNFSEPEPVESLEQAVAQSHFPQFDEMASFDAGFHMPNDFGPEISDELNTAFEMNDEIIEQAVPNHDGQRLETIVENELAQLSPGPQMPVEYAGAMDMDAFSPGYGPEMDPAMQEVEQAIEEEKQAPDFGHPDPFQMQYGPEMAQQYMFDPMYMPDYMHPQSMPFGHMGPMLPGPGFGPM